MRLKKKRDKEKDMSIERDSSTVAPDVDGLPKKQGGSGKGHAGMLLGSLFLAGMIFLILMNIEKNMLDSYEKTGIVTSRKQIPTGTVLTKENAAEYLELKEVESAAIPQRPFQSLEEVYEQALLTDLDKGVLLSASMLEPRKIRLERLKAPVVAGFRAEDISQMVCGTLRSGDIIHIYVTNGETGDTVLVWEDVLVEQAFDGSGIEIPVGDQTSSAQAVNVLLDKESMGQFYTELAKGSIKVVKDY